MFDRKKLEKFLDSLQVESHFPSQVPRQIVQPPRSPLDEKMDKYDLFVQGNFSHNHGTSEFPLYGPEPNNSFGSGFYTAVQWALPTYGALNRLAGFMTTGLDASTDNEEAPAPSAPVLTAYDRFKHSIDLLAEAPSIKIPDLSSHVPVRSPDFVHTLTAWRGWEVSHGMLESLGTNSRWEPCRAPRANCIMGRDHSAPDASCECGYWSFKTRESLVEALGRYAQTVDVIGQVEIWGRVIECENGFRSEFAYPKELWLLDSDLESLSWKYGVPVRKLP
jgi:hypothetical protein